MSLTAILARSDDGVIGIMGPKGPCLPWRLGPDLKRFRELTTGHAVIMGRKTFDSMGRKALQNRHNIVVSRNPMAGSMPGGVDWAGDPEDALYRARLHDLSPFLIGGAEIYAALWKHVSRVEVTEVHTAVGVGVQFSFIRDEWRESFRSEEQVHDGIRFHFVTLERAS